MGEVVRKNAAVETIAADTETTLENAKARGGKWSELADLRLRPVAQLLGVIRQRQAEVEETLKPLLATLGACDVTGDQVVGKASDDLWNAAGRPAHDPWLTTIFPGGIDYYTGQYGEEQVLRMELLAELLTTIPIPKVSAELMRGLADQVQAAATPYRAAVEAARMPLARQHLLEKVYQALARLAQMELAHLKRLYKTEGFSEADIHKVIPDRPAAAPAKKPEPTPTPAA